MMLDDYGAKNQSTCSLIGLKILEKQSVQIQKMFNINFKMLTSITKPCLYVANNE